MAAAIPLGRPTRVTRAEGISGTVLVVMAGRAAGSRSHVVVATKVRQRARGRQHLERKRGVEPVERRRMRHGAVEGLGQRGLDLSEPIEELAQQRGERVQIPDRNEAIDVGGWKEAPVCRDVVQPGRSADEGRLGMSLEDLANDSSQLGGSAGCGLRPEREAVGRVAEMDADRALIGPVVVAEAVSFKLPIRSLSDVSSRVGAAIDGRDQLLPSRLVRIEAPSVGWRASVVVDRHLVEGREAAKRLLGRHREYALNGVGEVHLQFEVSQRLTHPD